MAKVQSFDHIDKLNVNNLANALKINELATAQGATVPTDNNGLSFAFSTQAAKTKVSEALPNVQIDTHFLERLITGEAPKAKDECARLAKLYYEGGDASFNTLSNNEKNKLPYFLPSGFCPIHHNDATLDYNGCVQIDIDFKFQDGDVKAIEIKNQLALWMQNGFLSHLVFVAISPRLYGVKALVFTDNQNKEYHKSLVQVLKTELSNLLNIDSKQIDNLSLSQPCFVPFDKTAFFNHNPTPYNYQHVEFAKTDAQKLAEQKARLQVNNAVTTNYEGEKLVISAFDKLTMCEAILRHKGTSAGRYRFCFELARMVTKYDVSLDDTLSFCMDYVERDFAAKEVEQAVKGAYRYGKKAHFEDYQLLKYAKLLGTFIPSHLLEWKPRITNNSSVTVANDSSVTVANDSSVTVANDEPITDLQKKVLACVVKGTVQTAIIEKNVETEQPYFYKNIWNPYNPPKVTTYKGEKNEYFSEVLRRYQIELTGKNICGNLWIVPTGAGKTYLIGLFAKQHKTVILCPTIALTESCKEYGATPFCGENASISSVVNKRFISCTYASFTKLCTGLIEKQPFILEELNYQLSCVQKKKDALTDESKKINETIESIKTAQKNDSVRFANLREKERNDIQRFNEQLTTIATTIATTIEPQRMELINEIEAIQNDGILGTFHLVIDEFHNFTSATNEKFMLDQLRTVLKWKKSFESFTGVTGTFLPNAHPCILEMPIMYVDIPQETIPYMTIECKNTLHTVIQMTKNETIAKGHKAAILMNDKSMKLETVKTGFRDINRVAVLNAETKGETDFTNIIENKYLLNDVKVLISTTVLKEGNDIKNNDFFDVYIIGRDFHAAEIKQFVARFRAAIKNKKIRVFHLVTENKTECTDKTNTFCWQSLIKHTTTLSTMRCLELNYMKTECSENDYLHDAGLILKNWNNIKDKPIHYENGVYEIDFLNLSNEIFNQEKSKFNHNNIFKDACLTELNFDLFFDYEIWDKYRDAKLSDSENAKGAIARDDLKAKEQNEYDVIIDDLKNTKLAVEIKIKRSAKKRGATKIEKRVYQNLDSLSKFYENTDDLLTDVQNYVESPKLAAFTLLKRRLLMHKLENVESFMSQNNILSIMMKAFRSIKTDRIQYESTEIQMIVTNILKCDKSIDIASFEDTDNITKYVNILKLFWDVETERRLISGEKISFYRLKPLKFSIKTNEDTKVPMNEDKELKQLFEAMNNDEWFLQDLSGEVPAYRFRTDLKDVPF
jgi:VirE N-terminal domain